MKLEIKDKTLEEVVNFTKKILPIDEYLPILNVCVLPLKFRNRLQSVLQYKSRIIRTSNFYFNHQSSIALSSVDFQSMIRSELHSSVRQNYVCLMNNLHRSNYRVTNRMIAPAFYYSYSIASIWVSATFDNKVITVFDRFSTIVSPLIIDCCFDRYTVAHGSIWTLVIE